jgi:3-deoxy-manno-octulosonate cytidylyltransferase (CMP-KDO synthetase)
MGVRGSDIVVNLQGDEPFIPPSWLSEVASELTQNPDKEMATLATPFTTQEELSNPNLVKVVRNQKRNALYFSRSCIPFCRDAADLDMTAYLRHIGIYGYRGRYLKKLIQAGPCQTETLESLEQLRALDLGFKIGVRVVKGEFFRGIDVPEDLVLAEKRLKDSERQV